MTRLTDIPDEASPTHLLLIGDTKTGKSTYVAQAAIDGYVVLYADSDNGLSALKRLLKDNPAAMARVIYFGTENLYKFMESLLTNQIFRWNLTKDTQFSSAMASPDDKIVEIVPSRIPRTIILGLDSWTSMALDAMDVGATNKKVALESMGAESQGVYGEAGTRLTLAAAIIQRCPFNVIAIGHRGYYERLEKPPSGGVLKEIKQKDMIIKETIQVPMSSSYKHGLAIGKYFTDIGWLEIDRMDKRTIDFTIQHGRVGGGTINQKGGVNELSWSKCFGPVPPEPVIDESWIRYMTAQEFAERQAAAKSPVAKPAGVSEAGVINKTPASPVVKAMAASSLLKR